MSKKAQWSIQLLDAVGSVINDTDNTAEIDIYEKGYSDDAHLLLSNHNANAAGELTYYTDGEWYGDMEMCSYYVQVDGVDQGELGDDSVNGRWHGTEDVTDHIEDTDIHKAESDIEDIVDAMVATIKATLTNYQADPSTITTLALALQALNTKLGTIGAVTSFNSRTGAVTPADGDYIAAQVTYDNTGDKNLTSTQNRVSLAIKKLDSIIGPLDSLPLGGTTFQQEITDLYSLILSLATRVDGISVSSGSAISGNDTVMVYSDCPKATTPQSSIPWTQYNSGSDTNEGDPIIPAMFIKKSHHTKLSLSCEVKTELGTGFEGHGVGIRVDGGAAKIEYFAEDSVDEYGDFSMDFSLSAYAAGAHYVEIFLVTNDDSNMAYMQKPVVIME